MKIFMNDKAPLMAIIISTIISLIVSLVLLSSDFYIIFQNLFYIPIIIACVYYLRRGFVFSVLMAFVYFILLLSFAGTEQLVNGLVRVILFIVIAAIITILAEKMNKAEEELEQKNAELSSTNITLKESRDRYHLLFEGANDAIFLHKIDENRIPGRFLEVNMRACNILGYSYEELRSLTVMDIAGEKAKSEAKEQIDRLYQKGDHTFESSQVRRDGTTFPVEVSSHLIRKDDGDLILSVVRDITERKESEEALRKSEERFRAIFDESPIAIELYDENGELVHVNIAGLELFGVEDMQFLKGFSLFDDPNISDEYKAKLRNGETVHYEAAFDFEKVKSLDLYPTVRNGTIWIDVLITPLRYDRKEINGYLVQVQDFTAEKRAREEILLNNIILSTQQETSPDGILIVDEEGKIISFNHHFIEIWGIPDEVIRTHDDDQALSYVLHKLKDPDEFLERVKYLYTHKEEKSFEEIELADGRVLDRFSSPMYGDDSTYYGRIWYFRDITERIKAQKAIKQTNKKLSLLSSITRHDILNQITGAAGFIQLLQLSKEIPPGTKAEDYIEKVSGAIETIKRQVLFTKDYKDLGEQEPKWINVGDVVSETYENSAFEGLELQNDVKKIEIFADPLFEKVIYNLFDNAVKHGEKITRISFTVKEVSDGLVITCEDDGIGIPEEAKEKIFRREYFKNSGLGLFLSREILAITGMTIKENGKFGEGAKFEIHVREGNYRDID